uniref:Uncharacterized protein n=1 Tax=Panagrolaimus sp. JU765 TaxID=591449 RepID=A0AC34Q7N6_9BILA
KPSDFWNFLDGFCHVRASQSLASTFSSLFWPSSVASSPRTPHCLKSPVPASALPVIGHQLRNSSKTSPPIVADHSATSRVSSKTKAFVFRANESRTTKHSFFPKKTYPHF